MASLGSNTKSTIPNRQPNQPVEPTTTRGDNRIKREPALSPTLLENEAELEVDEEFVNVVAREAPIQDDALEKRGSAPRARTKVPANRWRGLASSSEDTYDEGGNPYTQRMYPTFP